MINAITSSESTVNDGTVTIQAGTLLSTGGSFTTNQASASTITLDHSTVSRSNTSTSVSPAAGATFTAVDQITSDSYGHITGVRTKTVTMPSSGSGGIALTDLSVGAEGTASGNGSLSYNSSTGVFTYSPPTAAGLGALTAHPNISAASSSNNSGQTFIQDITLDSNGHITAIATGTATGTVTTSQGGTATAGLQADDVGSYAFLKGSIGSENSTVSGSVMRFSNYTAIAGNFTSSSGTWRRMGSTLDSGPTVYLRIS